MVFIFRLDFVELDIALLSADSLAPRLARAAGSGTGAAGSGGFGTDRGRVDTGVAGVEGTELVEPVDVEVFRLGLKFFRRGGPDRASAKPPPPSRCLLLPGLELREQLSSDSSNFLFSTRLALIGLARGIFLASVTGVPPADSFSSVDRMTRAVEESGAGGEDAGPGELCGEEGAVLGSEDGGGPAVPRAGTRLTRSSRVCLSAALFLKIYNYNMHLR